MDLDAVTAAYGWLANLTNAQIWERLFALNQGRAPGKWSVAVYGDCASGTSIFTRVPGAPSTDLFRIN